MKAVFYERQGPAREVLELDDLARPACGAGEVLVRLHASGVNPSDVKSRSGQFGRGLAFPRIIPHSDGAGVIEEVGAGVDHSRIGERVWLWNGQWKRASGTCAELIALPAPQAVTLPDDVPFDVGACFGIPLITAVHAINLARAAAGRTLLIPGGAGAVAHYAIQIAAARGARVISTISSAEKAAIAREAGAEDVIDYRGEDVGARVRELTSGAGVDAVVELDLTANAALLPSFLRPHGDVVVYGMSSNEPAIPGRWLLQNNATLKLLLVYELDEAHRRAALDDIGTLLQAGVLRHRVAARFPLQDAAAAHEAVESGAISGNVVVTLGS